MASVLLATPVYSDVGVLLTPTLAGGSWVAGLPLTNVQDRRLHRVARSTNATPANTRFTVDLKGDRALRCVAMPKHNLSTAGAFRVTAGDADNIFTYIAGDDIATVGGVFARTGVASYVDRAGVVRSAATGVLRDDHWIGGQRTVLLEPASTNLCIRSEEFDNASWVKASGVTVTPNSTVAPDGATTADTITSDGSGTFRHTYRDCTFTGDGEKCAAIYLKQGTAALSGIGIFDRTASLTRHRLTVTWTAGVPVLTALDGAGTIYPVEALANGWYRLLFSATGVVAANTNSLFVYPAGYAAVEGTVYAWGAQAENAAVPSSYIATAAAEVTRNADSLYFDVAGVNPPRAMTVYSKTINVGQYVSTGAARRILHIGTNDVNADPRFYLESGAAGATAALVIFDDGVAPVTANATASPSPATLGLSVEHRGALNANWSATAGISVGGAAETTHTSATGTAPAGGAWAAARVYLTGGLTASNTRCAYTHVVIAEGVRTMDAMRDAYLDSGWVDAYPSGTDAETWEGQHLPLLHTFAAFTANKVSVQLHDPDNAATYLDIGRLIVAGGYQPEVNVVEGAGLGFETDTVRMRAEGGNAFYDRRPVRRTITATLEMMPEEEANSTWPAILQRHGTDRQLFFVWDPADTGEALRRRAFLCVFEDLSPITAARLRRYNAPFRLTEEL